MTLKKTIGNIVLTIVCVAVGIVIAMQFKNQAEASRLGLGDYQSVEELQNRLTQLQRANEELAAENALLRSNLYDLQSQQADEEGVIAQALQENNKLKIFAGLVNVEGPGAIITLTDSSQAKVRASDLLTLVNYIRAGNAQAISINGQRLVAMSEIQTSGQNIVINSNIISGQNGTYTMRIIADQADIASTYNMLSAYISSLWIEGIGVAIEYFDTVEVPALSPASPAYRFGLMEVSE